LSPSAAKALPYFFGKIKMGFNNPERYSTEFTFSYPEGLRLGFAHSTFAKIIRDLEELGFIDWVVQGGMRGKGKGYNRYILSKRWAKSNGEHLSKEEIRERKLKRAGMAIYSIPSNL